MQIEIKTLQNVRDSRVKLEIIIDPAEVEKVYDPDQAVEAMAKNYVRARAELTEAHDLVADHAGEVLRLRPEIERLSHRNAELEAELERYRRAHVCTVECKPNQHTAFQGRQRVTELETELADETERADRLTAELAETRKTLNEVNQAQGILLEQTRTELVKIAKIVNHGDVILAANHFKFPTGHVGEMIAAIEKVRNVLSSSSS